MSGRVDYAIEVENLTKVYDMGAEKVHALRGVSARIAKGDFWAVMGSSGSGKSTMLQILGCLDRPTSGTYRLNGREVSQLDDDALSDVRLSYLGFVFQSFNLIPQLTVAENIALPLYYRGVDDAEGRRRAAEYADYVGLGDRLKHRPSQLSGGQQQRVAIARALATDPVVILADEPTGNLDTKSTKEIMEIFEDMHEKGRTIILVTHEPEIAACASRQLLVRDGQITRDEGKGVVMDVV